MRDSFKIQMEKQLGEIGISLDEEKMEQFFQYYEMLIEKNKVMNLTAITEEEEVITKHFVDSLSLVKVLPELKEGAVLRIIDVGTGGGFPGIPLKIAFPDCHFTLLDSLNKPFISPELMPSMEGQRISDGIPPGESSMILQYPVQWQICLRFRSIVCLL